MDQELTENKIKAALQTEYIGCFIETYSSISSTNTRAVLLAQKGTPDGTLVLAEEQTAGRGRLGRTWLAPARSSLLFSVVLRPNLRPTEMQRTAMITSLAACRAVEELYGLKPMVKWPNDILLDGGKLGGMLSEAGMQGSELAYVVVGLGLNVNLDPADLGSVMVPAASISNILGHEVERLPLLVSLLGELDRLYLRVNQGWLPHREWRERMATIGEQVEVDTQDQVIHGRAVDVDPDGALILQLADGSTHTILAGDVTLRRHQQLESH